METRNGEEFNKGKMILPFSEQLNRDSYEQRVSNNFKTTEIPASFASSDHKKQKCHR
uniref:Uncharacterized protein n=1 Tax=Solanum tuberosum TaxID=4113 RepID=M1BVK9_SOLTU